MIFKVFGFSSTFESAIGWRLGAIKVHITSVHRIYDQ